jgi:hypothetical protein
MTREFGATGAAWSWFSIPFVGGRSRRIGKSMGMLGSFFGVLLVTALVLLIVAATARALFGP